MCSCLLNVSRQDIIVSCVGARSGYPDGVAAAPLRPIWKTAVLTGELASAVVRESFFWADATRSAPARGGALRWQAVEQLGRSAIGHLCRETNARRPVVGQLGHIRKGAIGRAGDRSTFGRTAIGQLLTDRRPGRFDRPALEQSDRAAAWPRPAVGLSGDRPAVGQRNKPVFGTSGRPATGQFDWQSTGQIDG